MKQLLLFICICGASALFAQDQQITVEKIWKNYEFVPASVAGFRSMNDGNYFSKTTKSATGISVTKHKFEDYQGSGETIISESMLKGLGMDDYSFNADETKALIATGTKSIYRRSYSAIYYLMDLNTKKVQPLDSEREPQTLAEYSPDGTKVSYIYKNNLFVKDIASGKVKQLTKDGETNKIINGTTDWVYEEEFAITKAYGWSPDSKWISFLKFDESNVREYSMKFFRDLYPNLHTFKYPKAGEDNSIVTAHLVAAKGGKVRDIDLGSYEYIPRMKWSSTENNLVIQTLNRHQNELSYHLLSMTKKKFTTKAFYTETSKTYIDVDDNLLILADGKTILRTSEKDGFNHIYALSFDGKSRAVTKGDWDVIECLGISESNKVYFSCAAYGPINKAIHSIHLDGTDEMRITSAIGTSDAEFSNGMKFFKKTYSTANTAPVYSLCDSEGNEISVMEDNQSFMDLLVQYNLPRKVFTKFKGHEKELNGWIITPNDFDSTKQYPVYINIYGGPGANTVSNSWGGFNYMYHQLLAQSGYIVVSVDPRGTMYRGAEFKKSTYLELGKLETEDFIAVAKELQAIPFIDAERIGIMGWSYGGFMTSLAMTKGADQFKMGIAVAPVTNWRYYDNIYTERFMRTPAENASGYDDNSPINHVDKLKGKYLIIHGSGDDNVHYQNTMEMINALVAADKDFDVFIYPNKNHGIYGGNTRNHLFRMMYDYTLKNL